MSKFYYNGVLLPEIPSDIVSSCPYVMILQSVNGKLYTYGSKSKPYHQVKSSVNRLELPSGRNRSLYSVEDDSWGEMDSSTKATYCDLSETWTIIWSNFDVPSGSATSTTVYFYGSEPEIPKVAKYLIRCHDVVYTITDNILTSLGVTELTAEVFQTHGLDEVPEWSVVSELVNPEILYWQYSDEEVSMVATMNATPFPQTIVSPNYNMTDDTILGVECAYVTASSNVVFAISVDDGVTWYMWTGEAWGDRKSVV